MCVMAQTTLVCLDPLESSCQGHPRDSIHRDHQTIGSLGDAMLRTENLSFQPSTILRIGWSSRIVLPTAERILVGSTSRTRHMLEERYCPPIARLESARLSQFRTPLQWVENAQTEARVLSCWFNKRQFLSRRSDIETRQQTLDKARLDQTTYAG